MSRITISPLAYYVVAVLLLAGCGATTATPLRAVDPSRVPNVTIACTGAASCMRKPECARCLDCVDGVCDYQPLGSVSGKTCDCYDGQVAFCYRQVGSAWVLGLKRCQRQADNVSFGWSQDCVQVPN